MLKLKHKLASEISKKNGDTFMTLGERIYKKRDDKQRIYRQIYDTIVAYQKDLENLLFTYLKYVISTSDEMKPPITC